MEMWAWLGAYLVGFGLLQLYLYRYFIKDDSPAEGTTADGGLSRADGTNVGVDTPESAAGGELVACPNCGAYNRNDPMFSYCQECATELG